MGLLFDNLSGELRKYLADAMPGGLLNPEWTPERVAQAKDAASGMLGGTE